MARKEISLIRERNERVEADKAWETSKTRRAIIAVLTYLVVYAFLRTIRAPSPALNALIPTAGFVLSTLTLSAFKQYWLRRIYRR